MHRNRRLLTVAATLALLLIAASQGQAVPVSHWQERVGYARWELGGSRDTVVVASAFHATSVTPPAVPSESTGVLVYVQEAFCDGRTGERVQHEFWGHTGDADVRIDHVLDHASAQATVTLSGSETRRPGCTPTGASPPVLVGHSSPVVDPATVRDLGTVEVQVAVRWAGRDRLVRPHNSLHLEQDEGLWLGHSAHTSRPARARGAVTGLTLPGEGRLATTTDAAIEEFRSTSGAVGG